jgi:RimJ/RimL family protein N-acetyltransferase
VAELGYWLGERFGHRGILTRCVGALRAHAFATGLHRLEILSATANLPSRALAERAGFVFEGVLRERVRTTEGYEDAALYARLASDVLR